MHELELAGHPSLDAASVSRHPRAPSVRTALIVSIVVHGLAVYALMLQRFAETPPPPLTVADYFVLERPAPRPEPAAETAPPLEPAPAEDRAPEPPPRAAEAEAERAVVVERAAPAAERVPDVEPAPVVEVEPVAQPGLSPLVDLDEERRRAAREVVTERAAEAEAANEYLTFSIDDVAPPRPEPEPETKSIFDGAGGPDFGGRSVGTVGQQRTKFGRKLAEICNALTGGFGVAFQGFGLFSACASPDNEPSGLFPEVRPAYLDLMPECADTRDTAPALALQAPFPTVKCRLVHRDELGAEP